MKNQFLISNKLQSFLKSITVIMSKMKPVFKSIRAQKFRIIMIFFCVSLKSFHQGCIYLIKNTVNIEIMILKNCFLL